MDNVADQQFFSRLALANLDFAERLPATLARLSELGAQLDPSAPTATAHELVAMLHTMAGSAFTFGYRGLGHHARALEQRLRVLLTFDAVAARDWTAWIGELGEFIEAGRRDPRGLS
jgi:HPt (histidine-containing phosphotransfer) domain-containing protein